MESIPTGSRGEYTPPTSKITLVNNLPSAIEALNLDEVANGDVLSTKLFGKVKHLPPGWTPTELVVANHFASRLQPLMASLSPNKLNGALEIIKDYVDQNSASFNVITESEMDELLYETFDVPTLDDLTSISSKTQLVELLFSSDKEAPLPEGWTQADRALAKQLAAIAPKDMPLIASDPEEIPLEKREKAFKKTLDHILRFVRTPQAQKMFENLGG